MSICDRCVTSHTPGRIDRNGTVSDKRSKVPHDEVLKNFLNKSWALSNADSVIWTEPLCQSSILDNKKCGLTLGGSEIVDLRGVVDPSRVIVVRRFNMIVVMVRAKD